jgi:phospho-N-acetylmuramoyl-pentapeptide-transferase
MSIEIITQSLLFLLISAALGFLLVKPLILLLRKFDITRRSEFDDALKINQKQEKVGTPIMGGLLVIVVVALITIVFNWDRRFTWVPIGVMVLSAALGGLDDVLNIYGRFRRIRPITLIKRLSKIHKHSYMRLWYKTQLPLSKVKFFFNTIGSRPGRGIQVHEKLLTQLVAGAITAWWLFFKLGPQWQSVWVPFDGEPNIGWLLVPLVILIVMVTANAVNVADGLDGLAGGALITAFGGLLVIAWLEGNIFFAILNATVIGALLPYTYFNIKPAKFQMGDVGSLGLGALLAVMTVAQNRILILPFLGFIFFVELGSVIVQLFSRHVLGKKAFKMAPLHHHLELKGWSEERIVQRFWLLNSIAVLAGLWLSMH